MDNGTYGIGNTFEAAELTVLNGGPIAGVGAVSQFIFDTVGKGVYYDHDGSGAGAAVLVATLDASIATISRASAACSPMQISALRQDGSRAT